MQVLSSCAISDDFAAPELRLDVICAVLIENEFGKWSDLQYSEDPTGWSEAGRLSEAELQFVRQVIAVGRQEPRCMCF